MIALLSQLIKRGKLALSILVLDLFVLIAIETVIVAATQQHMNFWVAIIGAIYMAATAGTIWRFGYVVVDPGFAARIFDLEIGRRFTSALKMFFFAQASIVTFFFFVPVWKFWPGYFIFLVILTGLMLSGSLAKIPLDWTNSWRVFSILLGIIGLLFFVALFAGRVPQLNDFSGQIDIFVRLAIVGLALLVSTSIFRKSTAKAGGLLKFIGFIMLAVAIAAWIFPETKEWKKYWRNPFRNEEAKAAVSAPTPVLKGVSTGVFVEPDKRVTMNVKPGKTPPPFFYTYNGGEAKQFPWTGLQYENDSPFTKEIRVEYPPGTNVSEYLDIQPTTGPLCPPPQNDPGYLLE